MKAVSAARTPADKARFKQKINDLVSQAERLKKIIKAGDSVSKVERRLKLPRMVRQLPTSEKNILLRASKLHGNIFPPWESDPDPDDFTGPLFKDPSNFALSERQVEVFAGWKRPLELAGFKAANPNDRDASQGLMQSDGDYDFVQDITTDCSLVASLCASTRHLRVGPSSILPALMFPVNSDNGQPKVSESGRYVFRMYFNGCFRKVVIDDRLPSSSNSRTLYVVDRQNPRLIWPALMEKAYLKVRGGYDFPGSNSGTDLWILTGWIPQQLFLHGEDIDFDQTWSRIRKAYDYGDVVVTLGTGRLTALEEETLGLAGEHDYAVLDISEKSGVRRMLVKNPWCDGLVWKGVGSASSSSTQDHPTKLKPGSFWIDFDDVAQNFESLYLNWNPALFTERQDHHFTWEVPSLSISGSFAHNPQYSMTATADGSIWILLSRHFQDEELTIAKSRSRSPSSRHLADVSNCLGFMSVYIFDHTNGSRVQLGDKSLYRGPFVDSPQMLAPLEAKKGTRYTIAIAQHGLPLSKYSFTLAVFSRCPLEIGPAPDPMTHYVETAGSWTRRTAGGNAASPSYLSNPQFALTVPAPGPLSILLCTQNEDLPVHVDLVWAGGSRVTALTVRDLVAGSGDYRRGCALCSVPNVDPGTYTVVCSTFEPGQLANFVLRVGSKMMGPSGRGVTVVPVLGDAAGKLRTAASPLLLTRGAVQRAPISVARLTRASVLVSPQNPQYRVGPTAVAAAAAAAAGGYSSSAGLMPSSLMSPTTSSPAEAESGGGVGTPSTITLRLRLERGRGPSKAVVASTGADEFRELGAAGLRTPEFDVDPLSTRRGMWIVVEQIGVGTGAASSGSLSPGAGVGVRVEVLSEGAVSVGEWETIDD
jgi:calpain-7